MPLTEKGETIKGAMEEQYGEGKGEQVFYASKNKGSISGVDKSDADEPALEASRASKEEERQRKGERASEQGEADPIAQLKDAELTLEQLEREQEQTEEGQERQNSIDDTKEQIRGLRDQIKNSTRQALGKKTADDALEDLERRQDEAQLAKMIGDAVDKLAQRLDAYEATVR
jgi:hypothetical protein